MYGSFSLCEIDNLTYLEAEEFYCFYNENENEKITSVMKLFGFYNLESSAIAYRGNKKSFDKYLDKLKDVREEEYDIADQFKDLKIKG